MWLVVEMASLPCGTHCLNSVSRHSRWREHPWAQAQFFCKICLLSELYTLMKTKYSLGQEMTRCVKTGLQYMHTFRIAHFCRYCMVFTTHLRSPLIESAKSILEVKCTFQVHFKATCMLLYYTLLYQMLVSFTTCRLRSRMHFKLEVATKNNIIGFNLCLLDHWNWRRWEDDHSSAGMQWLEIVRSF